MLFIKTNNCTIHDVSTIGWHYFLFNCSLIWDMLEKHASKLAD